MICFDINICHQFLLVRNSVGNIPYLLLSLLTPPFVTFAFLCLCLFTNILILSTRYANLAAIERHFLSSSRLGFCHFRSTGAVYRVKRKGKRYLARLPFLLDHNLECSIMEIECDNKETSHETELLLIQFHKRYNLAYYVAINFAHIKQTQLYY